MRLARGVPGRRAALALVLTLSACGEPSRDEVPLPALAGVEVEVAEALVAAHSAVVADPRSGKAWGRLADHYMAHNFNAEAARCYERAERLDGDGPLWSYRLAWCLSGDRPELALAPLERSLRQLETYAPAHRLRARLLARVGREEEALETWALAAALDPADPEAQAQLGMIRLARGDDAAAAEHFEQALARDERHVEAHIGLARAALALGQTRKAQRHSELSRRLPRTTLELDPLASPDLPPLGARIRTRVGQELEAQQRFDEAIEQYRAALRSNPDYYMARQRLANLYCSRDRRSEAIELLQEAERDNPSFEAVRRDIAKITRAGDVEPDEE